jgi:hypothetical protein
MTALDLQAYRRDFLIVARDLLDEFRRARKKRLALGMRHAVEFGGRDPDADEATLASWVEFLEEAAR